MGGLPQPLYLCTCFLSCVSDPCLAALVTAQSTPIGGSLAALGATLRFSVLGRVVRRFCDDFTYIYLTC